MTKRKIISVLLIAVVLCSVCWLISGCSNKNKKIDASMKIVCKEVVDGKATGAVLGEWTFPSDINEMHIEREYDGKEYFYYLSEYESKFYINKIEWKKCVEVHSALLMEGEPKDSIRKFVCEKGEYALLVYAFPTIYDDYNPRLLRLCISVK